MVSRRIFLASAAALGGCVDPLGTGAPSQPASTPTDAGTPGTLPDMRGNQALSPQVMFGRPGAPAFTEVALSLHCGATREYVRSTLRHRMAEVRAGQRVLILTHYVRTGNEVPLGVDLLRTGDSYPEAMLAILGLTARTGRALSAAEAQQFLAGAGIAFRPAIREQDARLALGAARVAYRQAGLTTTPFIREGRNTA